MRRLVILLSTASIWLIVTTGCSNNDNIVEPVVDSIGTAINLELFEDIDSGVRTIELRCLTDSIYPCANYMIGFGINISADSIELTFTEIIEPAICLTGTGPAFAIIDLSFLFNLNYIFKITVNNLTILAQLVVTDSTIEIIGGDSTWTDIVRPVLYRVPANTIWGEVDYNDPLLMDSAKTFFDSLISIGASPDSLAEGHYGYFYIDNAGAIDSILEIGPSIPDSIRIPFIYNYTGDTATLNSKVQDYAPSGTLIEVNVITSDGYNFRTF